MSVVGYITVQCSDLRHDPISPWPTGDSYGRGPDLFTVPAAEFLEFSMGRAFDDQHNLLSDDTVHKAMSQERAMCHHCFAVAVKEYTERMERLKRTGHDLADLTLRQLWMHDTGGVSFWFDWWRHAAGPMHSQALANASHADTVRRAMEDLSLDERDKAYNATQGASE